MQTQMQTRMTHMVFYFQLNFEKAFDSVDHSLLFGVLEKFSFGLNFIHWINTLYIGMQKAVPWITVMHSTAWILPLRKRNPAKGSSFSLSFYSCFRNCILAWRDEYWCTRNFLSIIVYSVDLALTICDIFQEFSSLRVKVVSLITDNSFQP